MESRMEMEAQYDEEMRDGRTLRQKVHMCMTCCSYMLACESPEGG